MRILKSCFLFISVVFFSVVQASSIQSFVDSIPLKTYVNNLTGIACDASAQRCVATGFVTKQDRVDEVIYRTQDAGRKWSKPITLFHSVRLPPEMDSLNHKTMKIACDSSGMLCHVAGVKRAPTKEYVVAATTYDGGVTWIKHRFAPRQHPLSEILKLTCGLSGENCVILGRDNDYEGNTFVSTTADMGQTWSEARVLPSSDKSEQYDEVFDMSCSDSGLVCTIIGGMETFDTAKAISFITHDGGMTWTNPLVIDEKGQTTSESPPISDVFSHIRCDGLGTTCIALRHLEIPLSSSLSFLTVVDAYRTVDSGLTWERMGTLDNRDGILYERIGAFDCSHDLQTCVAVHAPAGVKDAKPYVYVTHDAGATWTHRKLTKTNVETAAVMDLFCDDNATLCLMVGINLSI